MSEFTPKRIGNKDFDLENKIIDLYSNLCSQANEILFVLDSYLGYIDKVNLDPTMFFEFMNSEDAKSFLYSEYIKKHGIEFSGINIFKIIELGLVDVPLDVFSSLLDSRKKLLESIQLTEKLKFHFPLINLWSQSLEVFELFNNEDGKECSFASDFEQRLNEHTGRFTASESDNEIIEELQRTVDSLNNLMQLGLIKNAKGRWINSISQLSEAIVFNANEEIRLSINPNLKRMADFKRFFSETKWSPVSGRLQDLLKFVAPVPNVDEEVVS